MTVHIDVPTVAAIEQAAEQIQAKVAGCAKTLSGAPQTGVPGLLINEAITQAQKRFAEKADWCAKRWQNFAWMIGETVEDMKERDKENAAGIRQTVYEFQFPSGGPGVRD